MPIKPHIKGILAVLSIAALYMAGAFGFVENKLIDLRYYIAQRNATSNLVVVKIDAASLDEFRVWPWPRSRYAELLDRVFAAGAAEVAFDIDFSSESTASEDSQLAASLAKYGERVILPVFRQQDRQTGDNSFLYTEPLPQFRQYARVASLNIRPDRDGVLRKMLVADLWPSGFVPMLSTMLAQADQSERDDFYIDYGIRVETIPQISFARVLHGDFDPQLFRGKRVLIGASAIELGDIASVPVWSALPGTFVQALATESLLQGRALHRSNGVLVLLGILAIVMLTGRRLRTWNWRTGLAFTAGLIAATQAIAIAVQWYSPYLIDTAPWIAAAVLSYGIGLTGRIEDQSVRLLAQGLALRHQDAFMRRVVNNTFDGLATIDGAGCVRSFNPAAQRIFGHGSTEIVGQSFSALLTSTAGFGDGSSAITSLLAAVARSGTSRGIMGRRRDGSAFPMDLAVTEMQEGGTAVYIALVRDISARAAAESMAAEAQQRLVDAIESIPEAFVLYDAQDRILLFNEKLRELHGPAAHLITVGSRYEDVVRSMAAQGYIPEAKGRIQEWVRERMAMHMNPVKPFDLEVTDGRWLRICEQRTRDDGIVATLSDVTGEKSREHELRRARDEAELANRSKSEFLANMSHELRTPLNAIIGFAELMRNEVLGIISVPAYKGYVRDIHDSANQLLRLINDILDLSQIEAGKLKLVETDIDLGSVALAIVRLIGERATESGIKITVDAGSELPRLRGDERIIKQILINLLSNAVKFSTRGGTVTVKVFQEPDDRLACSVIDTGIGISESDIGRVMEPFNQSDGIVRRRHEGTGLGLTLVRSFVELHGGSFELKSRVGAGTSATVRLPADRTVKPAAADGDGQRRSGVASVTALRSVS
ncbi:MAG: CHASE2 domain-containing protein [Dongiaceae bacterium]